MNEATWLASSDVKAMLNACLHGTLHRGMGTWFGNIHKISERKLRLFACACCRQVWRLLTDKRSRNAVEVAEWFADGAASELALRDAYIAASVVRLERHPVGHNEWASAYFASTAAETGQSQNLVENLMGQVAYAEQLSAGLSLHLAHLLREIVGNPFQPVKIDTSLSGVRQSEPTWFDCRLITPTVLWLGHAAYDDADNGTLNPARLAVLSDALEEAGCDNEMILRHLRGWEWFDREPTLRPRQRGWLKTDGPHVRGCWALDLLLGKD